MQTVSRKTFFRMIAWMCVGAVSIIDSGEIVRADDNKSPAEGDNPSSYIDVATLPPVIGEEALLAFIPREGRYVMKVKRGWSGQFIFYTEDPKNHWMLADTTEVGAQPFKIDDGSANQIFPSRNPVLEAVSVDRVSRFVAVRTGAAKLRYVGVSSEEHPKNIVCELRIEVEADTSELDRAILLASPHAKIKVTEIRSAALLTGSVPSVDDVTLVTRIAEQFYPDIISQIKVAANTVPAPRSTNPDLVPQVPTMPPAATLPPVPRVPSNQPEPSEPSPVPTTDDPRILPAPGSGIPSPAPRRPIPLPADPATGAAPPPAYRPQALPQPPDDLRSLHDEIRGLRRDVLELKTLLSRRLELDQRGAKQEKLDRRDDAADVPNGMLAFTATWCGPCQQMRPIIQSLQRAGFPIRSVDVDEEPKLMKSLGIDQIPQFVVVVDGKVQKRITGMTTKGELVELLASFRLLDAVEEGKAIQKVGGERPTDLDETIRLKYEDDVDQKTKSGKKEIPPPGRDPRVTSNPASQSRANVSPALAMKEAKEKELRLALDRPIKVEFANTPLVEAIREIQEQLQVNIALDQRGLKEAHIKSTQLVSLGLKDVSARSAFRLLLEPLNLGIVIEDEVIKVTSLRLARGDLTTVTYPLKRTTGETSQSCNSIAELIVTTIEPDSWEGGEVSIKVLEPTNSLAIRQTKDVHDQIEALIAQIDQTQQKHFDDKLKRSSKPDTAKSVEVVRTYAVADLIVPLPNPDGKTRKPEPADWFRLMECITSEVSPECWDLAGGICTVRGHEPSLSLVIRAPESVHDQVVELLARERKKHDLNVVFEVKVIEAADDNNHFQREGIEFKGDVAMLELTQADALLSDVTAHGGNVLESPKVTAFNGNLANWLPSQGSPIVPELYLRGSAAPGGNEIRVNAAVQSKSVLQDLINRTIKVPDGGMILFDATDNVRRDSLGLPAGHRVYILVKARLQIVEEVSEKRK